MPQADNLLDALRHRRGMPKQLHRESFLHWMQSILRKAQHARIAIQDLPRE